jgi:hypothetical protein
LSNDPNGLDGASFCSFGHGDPFEGVYAQLEAKTSPEIKELVWVDYPACYAFENKATYYGNDVRFIELH